MTSATKTPSTTLRAFIALYTPLALVVVIGALAMWLVYNRSEDRAIRVDEANNLHSATLTLRQDYRTILSDMDILIGSRELRYALDTSDDAALLGFSHRLAFFAKSRHLYSQIRFIDVTGQEVVRIDFDGKDASIAPPDGLQDKSGRDYVQRALDLPEGGLYISRLELNVEHGQVERPLKPVMRFSAPVYDTRATLRGVLVLNYLAAPLLDNIKASMASHINQPMLLDDQGQWLLSPNSDETWAVQLGLEAFFSTRQPDVWALMTQNDHGTTLTDQGLYSFVSLDPTQDFANQLPERAGTNLISGPQDFRLIVASLVPQSAISESRQGILHATLSGLALVLFLLAYISWHLSKSRIARERIQHQAEESARQAERSRSMMLQVLDTIPVRVFWKDQDLVYQGCNALFAKDAGFMAPQDVIGKTDADMPWQSEVELYQADDRKVISSGTPRLHYEEPQTRPDGSVMWLETSKVPLTDDAGHITGILGTYRDITERKAAEKALKDNEKRFRDFTQAASDWYWEMDDQLRVVYLSEKFDEIIGTSRLPLQGKTRKELATQEQLSKDPEKWAAHFEDLEQHRAFNNFEYDLHVPASGRVVGISISGVPVFDDTGAFKGFRGTGTDVTEKKAWERALLAAKEEAEAANMAKNEFLSSMSHELRTPLNAILGFGQLLQNDPDAPLNTDQKDAVDHILKGGDHLLGLIDEILDLAKIEAGQMSVSIEPLGVRSVLHQVLAMSHPLAERFDVTLENQVDCENLPSFLGDLTRLKQVLLNLISNAIKYNHKGGRVTIEAESTEKTVRFCVTDTGPGIAESRQADLFTPFNRLGAEAGEIEGTGIGLTISKKLMTLMDGDIGFHTVPGEGSTFWVELKRAAHAPDEPTTRIDEELNMAPPEDAISDTPKTVLYIEDNPANLKLMEKILERVPNLRMLSAHTAEIGLAIAESELPDVILMDINLPGMDGVQALKELQGNEKTNHIPVIAISANAMPRDIEAAMDAGFTQYLTKPYNIPKVLSAIREACGEPAD